MSEFHVLLVEDSPLDIELLMRVFRRSDVRYVVEVASDRATFESLLTKGTWDIVVTDFNLPQFGALQVLEMVKRSAPYLPVIVISGAVGETTAVEILKQGASDFIMKDNLSRLCPAIQRTLREKTVEDHAKAANKARESLMAVVSHDLKNPLAAIQLSLDMIIQTIERSDTEEQRMKDMVKAQTERALRSSKRMMSLIQDLLDQAKIEAGRLAVEQDRYKIKKILNDLTDEFSPIAASKGIRFEVSQVGDERADFDYNRMYQALGNLLGNAMKFTPAGGTVYLQVQLTAEQVRFDVRDTGQGMGEESLRKIFEAYWQEKNASRQGIGLGLSITKGIVESHGGQVTVESFLGQGSTFSITLPRWTFDRPTSLVDEEIETTTVYSSGLTPLIDGFKVLLVDDDEDLRAVMKDVLVGMNLEVIDVSSGEEAITQSKLSEFDLMVVDYRISDMTGADFALTLEETKERSTPLILVSADADLREKILPDNIVSRLSKPIHLPKFIETVKRTLPLVPRAHR